MRLFWFSRHRKVDAMLDAARELPVIQEKPIFVPYSESDVCWCQPFDGPTHPRCPMHGEQADLAEERELVFTGIDKHFLETVGIRE